MATERSSATSTRDRHRAPPSPSATALTGRFSVSRTSKRTRAPMRQQRAAPAPRPEGTDRRQGQKRGIDGQDWAVRREIIGRAAGRRGNKHPVADQFGDAHFAVDQNAQLGRLAGLAQQGDFVEGERVGALLRLSSRACAGDGFAPVRPSASRSARSASLYSFIRKPTRTEIHAVDRLAAAEKRMQRLQHEAVAAQRHDDRPPSPARHPHIADADWRVAAWASGTGVATKCSLVQHGQPPVIDMGAGHRGRGVAAVDHEIMAFGFARDGFVDGAVEQLVVAGRAQSGCANRPRRPGPGT